MLREFLTLAVEGSSDLMLPIVFLVVALGFAGLVLLILIGRGRTS